jgi:hypothetical protein
MTEERRINQIEDMLREAGKPETPPAHFRDAARQAALGGGSDIVQLRSSTRVRARGGRVALAAAVLVASAAAALVIGVGGNRMEVVRSVHLSSASPTGTSASAVLDIGSESNNVRDLVVHVDGLKPAPEGGYYELWMQNGGDEPTGIVAFDTNESGDADAKATLPAGMGWTRCWVTLETANGSRTTVLQAS